MTEWIPPGRLALSTNTCLINKKQQYREKQLNRGLSMTGNPLTFFHCPWTYTGNVAQEGSPGEAGLAGKEAP